MTIYIVSWSPTRLGGRTIGKKGFSTRAKAEAWLRENVTSRKDYKDYGIPGLYIYCGLCYSIESMEVE